MEYCISEEFSLVLLQAKAGGVALSEELLVLHEDVFISSPSGEGGGVLKNPRDPRTGVEKCFH